MKFTTESLAGGHLTEAIFHLNAGLVQKARGSGAIDISRALSDCLNKLQTTWELQSGGSTDGEMAKFRKMLRNGLVEHDKPNLLRSAELSSLGALTPLILSHKTLTEGKYQPGVPIVESLSKDAAEDHLKLKAALKAFQVEPSAEVADRVINRTANLLYVVRSNINHGEKTPFGPDHAKRGRDQQVCQVTIPVQNLVIDLLLGRPRNKLVVYGSLAPGQVNHEVLDGIRGTWRTSTVQGTVSQNGGLKMLHWTPGGEPVEIQIFESNELPTLWARLDEFEGSRYIRQVVTVGGSELAYAYLSADTDT